MAREEGTDKQPRRGAELSVASQADDPAGNVPPGLGGVPVKLRVVLGSSKISFEDAANLTSQSLLLVDRTATDPVDVVVNGKLIARGKLVVIDDTYGVQITELVEGR